MQTQVVVHKTQEDLDAWIKEKSTRGDVPMEEWGQRLYEQRGCKGCHSIDGASGTGPTWKDSYGVARDLTDGQSIAFDENYVRESILNPKAKIAKGFQPVMPSYKGQLSDDDIDSLIAFMKTLSKNYKPEADKKAAGKEKTAEDNSTATESGGEN